MTTTVTSTEFQRNVGTYTDTAMREPVIITSHKREKLVLISAEDYRRLRKLDSRRAIHPSEMPEDVKKALDESIARDEANGVIPTDYPVVKF